MKTFLLTLAAAVAATAPPLDLGTFETTVGLGGIVVAAPHEGFDMHTATVASAAATVLGSGFVVATGFRAREHLINVNRPTEGVGLAPRDETWTERATTVYSAYLARLGEAARGKLRLLVEIHGNARAENVGVSEVATVGISRERALILRTRLGTGIPQVRWKVEPLDSLHYQASGSKQFGALSRVPQALHFELPLSLRASASALDTGAQLGRILQHWLSEASASGRPHLWSGRV